MKKIFSKKINITCVRIIMCVVCVFSLLTAVGITTLADRNSITLETYELKGLGRAQMDVDGSGEYGDNPEDFVYDADDLYAIEDLITNGKTSLATSLNQYPNTEVLTLDTFANLSTAIDNLTAVPDIYYYDKATEGDSCVRYMYEDGSYYPCNEYGEKTSDTALEGTITVVTKDDTTEAAEGEIQLVKYSSTSAANLSAGAAGYVDKALYLGSGSDNITYRNLGSVEVINNIKYQTVTKSISLDSMQSQHIILTFSELSKISGISKITYTHSAGSSIITYSQNISGNKVDTYFVEYAGRDGHSVKISITAFEIP